MANSGGEDKTRTSQTNNNNNNNTPGQLKPTIPVKAMPIAAEELPTNNNMSLIKAKPVAMKAVPLPSQDMPPRQAVAKATTPMEEEMVKPALKPTPKPTPKATLKPTPKPVEISLNGPTKETKEPVQLQKPEKKEAPAPQPAVAKEVPQSQPAVAKVPPLTQPAVAKDLPPSQPAVPKESPKLQRSKSFVANKPASPVANNERRHSVAIMAKEVDVIEQPSAPIETITIEDDDESEEEEQLKQQEQQLKQQEQQQKEKAKQKEIIMPILPAGITISTTSRSAAKPKPVRKDSSVTTISSRTSGSSSNSSDVEEISHPAMRIEEELSLRPGISIIKAESLPLTKEDFERSLRCDEQVPRTPPKSSSSASSSGSNASDTSSPPKIADPLPSRPSVKNGKNSYDHEVVPGAKASSLKKNMMQNLGMLKWRGQQPANLQNSTIRFELNHFNLLQINERCQPRQGPAAYFERALYDRPGRRPSGSIHPLLYLCQRCNCHGPAADFLAPHYCSVGCVRRAQKRRLPQNNQKDSKMSRTQVEQTAGAAPEQKPQVNNYKSQSKSLATMQEELQRRYKEKPRKPFRWSEYLKTKGKDVAAPIHLFLNPFPISPNCFERGMKLEAIDPENCSLFCVCSIVEVRGYRLKLSFDGYSSMYDFWVNADSQDIFPPGWCDETARVLQAPKDYNSERFSWSRYLVKTGGKAAPRVLFAHLNMQSQTGVRNGFAVGMHLEAEDLNDTGKICVATVTDILDERIRVHFDGWDDCYDLWVHVSSPYIHPCGWHEGRQQLIVPPERQKSAFNWDDYISEVGGTAASKELFNPRQPMEYQARMKLEVVDQRNPCLIRPATVVTRKGYRVQLHLDCWPTEYYFWLEDDSPDLHPIGWCEATSHDLETPPGYLQAKPVMPCDVEGCRGYGNAKRLNLNVHALRDCCPYAPENWRQWRSKTVKPPRVPPEQIRRGWAKKPKRASSEAKQHAIKEEVQAENARQKPEVKAEAKRKTTPPRQEKVVKKQKKDAEQMPDERSLAIAKSLVKDYGPQFLQNYRLWQQNSAFDMDQVRTNPLHWTSWDVYEFIERALNSVDIARSIFEQDIDGRALLMLGRSELDKYLKLKVGPAVKLYSLIVNLRIAVVCKFETSTSGLAINGDAATQREKKKKDEPLPAQKQEPPPSNGYKVEHERELSESGDDEDVVLDSDDFLSVKPSSLVIDEDADADGGGDGDVVMVPLEVRMPMSTASYGARFQATSFR
ncbi:lethal(3)malignant brain tumor-like protein 3 isoform X2 [Drosophila biarmipes]|nr:lethal(3)malignant brain tumor-like protein 3 isoform X2 [Drosophila biarmipes]